LEELPPARIWKGEDDYVPVLPGESLVFTAPTERGTSLRWEREFEEPLIAPLPAGTTAGSLVLYDDQGELRRFPLVTAEAAAEGNLFKRLWDSVRLFFQTPGKGETPNE
jgi:D-alanyl-D-alanine carboxypeptidase (penicillin-binding protein 5/6)